LAAGASTRLGEPKQLIQFQGTSLLQRIIDSGEKIETQHKVLILGANQELIEQQTNFKSFTPIMNKDWEEGMSSSVRLAVEFAEESDLNALLILLSDQPYVDSELLQKLVGFYVPDEEMLVASKYGEVLGVPALFDRHYCQDLKRLTGDSGARKLIQAFLEKVKVVRFDQGNIDIDTPSDLSQLKTMGKWR